MLFLITDWCVLGYAAGIPGIDIIVDGNELAKGVEVAGKISAGSVGGTSAVAPLWAGLIALLIKALVSE